MEIAEFQGMSKQHNPLFGSPSPSLIPQVNGIGDGVPFSASDGPPATKGLLRHDQPAIFRELMQKYERLLDTAVEQADYKSVCPLSPALSELGAQLGCLQARPRDVIELHNHALAAKLASAPPCRAPAYVAEGRLLVLELMGHVLAYYRTESLRAGDSPHPAHVPNSASAQGWRRGLHG